MKPWLTSGMMPLVREILQVIHPDSKNSGFLTESNRYLPKVGSGLTVESVAAVPWASATFEGHAITLVLGMRAPIEVVCAARARLASLPDIDIPLAGQIVADIKVERVRTRKGKDGQSSARFEISALTITD